MAISVVDDIKSLSEFKRRSRAVFQQLHRTGRPVILTVNGRPDVVLLDVAVFERKLKALNLAELVARGEADIKARRVRSARAFLNALKHGKKIPG